MRKRNDHGWCLVASLLGLLIIAVLWVILSCKAGAICTDFTSGRNQELLTWEKLPTGEPTEYRVTGYVPTCAHCCGKTNGITASGKEATVGNTIAMKGVDFGTKVFIDGLGWFTVEDRGVTDGVIDIACASHEECYAITGKYEVWFEERD